MASPVNLWEQALLRAHSRLLPLFCSASSQQRCLAYLLGLLSDVERKNGWQLAEWLGERSPDGIQYFLERAHWDAEAARDILRDYVTAHLGDEQGILIIDETGFIK
uniref:transposase n=1 Tax=Xenorhabdus bharatensis TaxID=3136256 RepID=UPI0030F43130